MFDQKTDAVAACNSDVRLSCLTRSVHHAAHNSYADVQRIVGYHGFYFICQTDKVNLGSSAGRAGNNFHTAFSESQGL